MYILESVFKKRLLETFLVERTHYHFCDNNYIQIIDIVVESSS